MLVHPLQSENYLLCDGASWRPHGHCFDKTFHVMKLHMPSCVLLLTMVHEASIAAERVLQGLELHRLLLAICTRALTVFSLLLTVCHRSASCSSRQSTGSALCSVRRCLMSETQPACMPTLQKLPAGVTQTLPLSCTLVRCNSSAAYVAALAACWVY